MHLPQTSPVPAARRAQGHRAPLGPASQQLCTLGHGLGPLLHRGGREGASKGTGWAGGQPPQLPPSPLSPFLHDPQAPRSRTHHVTLALTDQTAALTRPQALVPRRPGGARWIPLEGRPGSGGPAHPRGRTGPHGSSPPASPPVTLGREAARTDLQLGEHGTGEQCRRA